jgi:aquaporin Z
MGVAMGTTAIAIITSPWGRRSGAHFNPAVTLTFLRLGKITRPDAIFYIAFQFIGGIVGVALAWLIFGRLVADSSVNFVATLPGVWGAAPAFLAEVVIGFFMMTMILFTSNSTKLARFTPYFAGSLVTLYIWVESPISGMSMNPARTLASAAFAGTFDTLWIYFLAPPVAMLAASQIFVKTRGLKAVLCAKLDHSGEGRCIFNCDFGKLRREEENQPQINADNADRRAALKSASSA